MIRYLGVYIRPRILKRVFKVSDKNKKSIIKLKENRSAVMRDKKNNQITVNFKAGELYEVEENLAELYKRAKLLDKVTEKEMKEFYATKEARPEGMVTK